MGGPGYILIDEEEKGDGFDGWASQYRSYFMRIRSIAPANLIGYWPGNEASGTLAKGYGKALEYLINGGFETAGAGGADIWGTWVETAGDGALADEATLFHGGAHAAKVTAGATANTKIAQTFATQPETVHTLTFWTRGDGTNGGRYLVYDVTNAADIIAATETGVTGTDYTLVTVSVIAPANCVSIRLDLMCPTTNGGICYFDDVSVMAVANGKYTGVTLGQPGIGDGFTCPLYDGVTNFLNVYSAGLINALGGAEGTISIWAKVSASGVWTDGTTDYLCNFLADANNYVSLRKLSAPNNQVIAVYSANGTVKTNTMPALSSTNYLSFVFVWSKAGDFIRFYLNGTQNASDGTGLGVWAGSVATCVVGTNNTVPANVWNGNIAHMALWNSPLALSQIKALARAH